MRLFVDLRAGGLLLKIEIIFFELFQNRIINNSSHFVKLFASDIVIKELFPISETMVAEKAASALEVLEMSKNLRSIANAAQIYFCVQILSLRCRHQNQNIHIER